ncbi:sodium/hydrogen exchanger 8 isoform X3 [Polyodon spathula]|uniref:sodium/hydrogen exchanger 8 isoform X3 n=1 Tax=Polyodon spathula TaxID=7913 RepID=UPI001B7E847A|nr:sodium/hydrogen exchanger 8 isoform X3 [Polyodon spathula]
MNILTRSGTVCRRLLVMTVCMFVLVQGIHSQHSSLHAIADTGKEDHIHNNNNNINNNNVVRLEPDAKVKSPNTGPEQTSRVNETQDLDNETLHTTTVAKATTRAPPTPAKPILPEQTGVEAQEEEQSSGMTIFFSLLVIGICIILVHLLIKFKLNFLPESVAVVSLGILMGAFIKIIEFQELANWKEEEMFRPNMFFLLLLPPIIFESGYSLHKGNFFQNIGSITLFAVFGTVISAFIVGGGIYFLGQADVIYKLTMTESFAFGSLISAVDPVATIAIFNALNVNPVLNMLVFGESILNDAVSIVLTNTAEGLTRSESSDFSGWQTFLQALGYFLKMFFGSAALGTLTGLISALALKHFDLRKTPSLEFGLMIIFAYLPYGLAEGIKLSGKICFFLYFSSFSVTPAVLYSPGPASCIAVFQYLSLSLPLSPSPGIMSILFSGIVMSHYTHHNLSPVTQILMQQTLRTVAFMCETCVFAFLGLSIFSFPHKFEISFVIWCIVLVLLGRAVNIFPLSFLINIFRDHKITPKMMFIMWFSGLRGAIPYALSLHLSLEPIEKRQLIGTTTIVIVLFTILLLGGSTMPLIRLIDIEDSKSSRKNKKDINLSKTEKMDLLHGRIQMKTLTNKWYEEVRQGPSGSEDEDEETELL